MALAILVPEREFVTKQKDAFAVLGGPMDVSIAQLDFLGQHVKLAIRVLSQEGRVLDLVLTAEQGIAFAMWDLQEILVQIATIRIMVLIAVHVHNVLL